MWHEVMECNVLYSNEMKYKDEMYRNVIMYVIVIQYNAKSLPNVT